MAQRVRMPHRGRMPFVCHSTPHFDSTSRKVSYSVAPIIHIFSPKVNTLFENPGKFFRFIDKPPGGRVKLRGENRKFSFIYVGAAISRPLPQCDMVQAGGY